MRHANDLNNENQAIPSEFKEAVRCSRENPNIVFDDQRITNYCKPNVFQQRLRDKTAQGLASVRSMTMSDYASLKYVLLPERLAYIDEWWSSPLPFGKKEMSPQDAPWFREPIYKSYIPNHPSVSDYVYVNLGLTDSFLIENFEKYLAEKRKSIAAKTAEHFRDSDFNNWAKLGILPYLDLIIWSLEEGIQIPNRIVADALYPTGEKGEETIRKTTLPLVESFYKTNAMAQLIMQAAADILEKNSA